MTMYINTYVRTYQHEAKLKYCNDCDSYNPSTVRVVMHQPSDLILKIKKEDKKR